MKERTGVGHMNNLLKSSLAVVFITVGLLASQLTGIGPAFATATSSCPSVSYNAPFWLWVKSANDVYGVRAPVEMRTDGGLCVPGSGSEDSFAAAWIGIQQQVGNGITQIGFINLYGSGWCRFWAIGTGLAHVYDCGGTSNSHYVYFEINRYYDSPTRTYRYAIYDCGEAGGYGNCTAKDGSQAAYGNPEGVIAAETDYGCTVQIMGTASSPTHYGTTSNPVEGFVTSWLSRTWGGKQTEGDCTSDYIGKSVTGGFVTWDSRNSSR
jgi:hypothetical protein